MRLRISWWHKRRKSVPNFENGTLKSNWEIAAVGGSLLPSILLSIDILGHRLPVLSLGKGQDGTLEAETKFWWPYYACCGDYGSQIVFVLKPKPCFCWISAFCRVSHWPKQYCHTVAFTRFWPALAVSQSRFQLKVISGSSVIKIFGTLLMDDGTRWCCSVCSY